MASAGAAEGQTPLRYAGRDADRMEAVLRDLGGFDRIERLRDPRPQALRAALDGVEQAAARDPGLQMVFYYSGHADERGLLIGAERFSFDELRARLEGSRAAVRVALIDACYAGTMVQTKGGAPAPGYALDLVAPTRVRGAAIIAAGTATELAQESGEIEGSYFTHHLLSALRGAGDRRRRRRGDPGRDLPICLQPHAGGDAARASSDRSTRRTSTVWPAPASCR